MAILKDYPIIDFSGGVVRNKSSYAMKKNELLSAYNVEIDELGRIKRKRGSVKFGTNSAYNATGSSSTGITAIDNGYCWYYGGTSATSNFRMFFNDKVSVIHEVIGAQLSADINTASTTVTVVSGGSGSTVLNFATFAGGGTGTVEIDGDLVSYTGVSSPNLTGVSAVSRTIKTGVAIHQSRQITQPSTAFDFTQGGYYTTAGNGTIPNLLFVNARNNIAWLTSGTDTNFDNQDTTVLGLFLTNYRDRLYIAGSGADSVAKSGVNKIFYSALGNGTSWATASNFDVVDQDGGMISGLKAFSDRLLIFTLNSFFSYNQVTLKQKSNTVGAYNHRVVQELNGLIYTFCPSGVFVTNGVSSKKISAPIEDVLLKFRPSYDALSRVVTNTFAFKYKDYYCLCLKNISEIENSIIYGLFVCYNTKTKSWTMWRDSTANGGTSTSAMTFPRFLFGGSNYNDTTAFLGKQEFEGYFRGGGDNYLYRLFENRYIDSTGTAKGTDLLTDFLTNASDTAISAHFETPLYDLAIPQYIKKFKYIRGLSEVVGWNAEYRVENKEGVTGYKPIGQFQRPNQRLVIPDTPSGYRIGFRFSNNDRNSTGVFNGFIIEDTEAIPSKQ
jgi:hypothetical protein